MAIIFVARNSKATKINFFPLTLSSLRSSTPQTQSRAPSISIVSSTLGKRVRIVLECRECHLFCVQRSYTRLFKLKWSFWSLEFGKKKQFFLKKNNDFLKVFQLCIFIPSKVHVEVLCLCSHFSNNNTPSNNNHQYN